MNPKLTKTRNPDQKHRHTKQQPTTDNEKKYNNHDYTLYYPNCTTPPPSK